MRPDHRYYLFMGILIAMTLGVWVFKSHMESKIYNRMTGAHTTTWEALWIEFRINSSPRE